jgi:hypothetical protein
MSPLKEFCKKKFLKKPSTKGLVKVAWQGLGFREFKGGGCGSPVNIIYKGAVKCCIKRTHQICNHITSTDTCDSWLIYLLYVWWEIDPILVLIIQQTLIHPPSQQIFVVINGYKSKGCVIY